MADLSCKWTSQILPVFRLHLCTYSFDADEKICAAQMNATCEECVAYSNCVYCAVEQACKYSGGGFPGTEICLEGFSGTKWFTCVMNIKFLLITFACLVLLLLTFTASCTMCCVRRSQKRRSNDLLAQLGIPLATDCDLQLPDGNGPLLGLTDLDHNVGISMLMADGDTKFGDHGDRQRRASGRARVSDNMGTWTRHFSAWCKLHCSAWPTVPNSHIVNNAFQPYCILPWWRVPSQDWFTLQQRQCPTGIWIPHLCLLVYLCRSVSLVAGKGLIGYCGIHMRISTYQIQRSIACNQLFQSTNSASWFKQLCESILLLFQFFASYSQCCWMYSFGLFALKSGQFVFSSASVRSSPPKNGQF